MLAIGSTPKADSHIQEKVQERLLKRFSKFVCKLLSYAFHKKAYQA